MPKLDRLARAYNGVIAEINEADAELDKLIAERDKLWKAAEAIFATGSPRRRKLVSSRK